MQKKRKKEFGKLTTEEDRDSKDSRKKTGGERRLDRD